MKKVLSIVSTIALGGTSVSGNIVTSYETQQKVEQEATLLKQTKREIFSESQQKITLLNVILNADLNNLPNN